MKKMLLTYLIGATFVLAACGADEDSGTETNSSGEEVTLTLEETKSLYSQNCSSCHGQILANGAPEGLDQIGSKLSKEEIEKIIRKGKGPMSGELIKGGEAAAVAEWLSNLK